MGISKQLKTLQTSKQVIADQKQQYAQCAGTLQKNEESECISLEKETHVSGFIAVLSCHSSSPQN